MNTDKKIFFFISNHQKLEKQTHFRSGLRSETYSFEYIEQRNNIKTSYYVKRIMEHYFPLKIHINSNTTTSFSPMKQPRGTDGPLQAK